MPRQPSLTILSLGVYRMLLRAYPQKFRDDYGPAMLQLFRDCCGDAERQGTATVLLTLWLRTLRDLATTAFSERMYAMNKHGSIASLWPYPVVLVLGSILGWMDLHTDDTQFSAALLLFAAFGLGFVRPRHAWRWGVLLAAFIPASELVAMGLNLKTPFPHRIGWDGVILPLMFGLVGAYLGAGMGVITRGRMPKTSPKT